METQKKFLSSEKETTNTASITGLTEILDESALDEVYGGGWSVSVSASYYHS